MSNLKRFIVGHRHGPRMDTQSEKQLETLLADKRNVKLLRRTHVGRCAVHLPDDQMRDFQRDNPVLVVEEDQALELYGMPGMPSRAPVGEVLELPVTVQDAESGKPVSAATVYGRGKTVSYKAVTDDKGKAVLTVSEPLLEQVLVSARDTFWSQRLDNVQAGPKAKLAVNLKPLLTNGCHEWGKLAMGFHKIQQRWTGRGVKIGIVDTGIINNHPEFNPSGGYNTLDGQAQDKWHVDEKGHGTHIAGLISAKSGTRILAGGAPDAEIYAIKVFPGGFISDLVEGIEWCIRNRMDIICLSLGVRKPSHVLAAVLRDAYDRGIVCISAAGNDRSHLAFPAAYPTTISVGAIGRMGTFPEDSGHSVNASFITDSRGGLFAAAFSNFGESLDFCAPGVSILSTVPTGYAAWDGTSMACGLVCALVALVMEAYPHLRTADPSQPEAIRTLLYHSAYDLGMPVSLQGAGMPLCPQALGAACTPFSGAACCG